jgi:hypothetical protein
MLVSRVHPDTAQGHAPGDDPGAPLAIAACRAAPGRDRGGQAARCIRVPTAPAASAVAARAG